MEFRDQALCCQKLKFWKEKLYWGSIWQQRMWNRLMICFRTSGLKCTYTYFHYFAAESKIQKSIFNQPACPLHPPTLDQHCDIGLAGAQDCHYAGDHCCCGRCFSSFVFSCVLDSESGNSTWQTTICPANGCESSGEFFLFSTNPLSHCHRCAHLTELPWQLSQ